MRLADEAIRADADDDDEDDDDSASSMRLMRRVSGDAGALERVDQRSYASRFGPRSGIDTSRELTQSDDDAGLEPLFRREHAVADSDSLIPVAPLKRWLKYSVRATLRRRVFAVLLLAASVLLVGMVLLAAPPTYEARASILIQDDRAITFGINPGRVDPGIGFATSGVLAVVTNQTALNRIIDEAGLLDSDRATTFFGNLRSGIMESLRGEPTLDGRRDVLLTELEEAIILTVASTGDQIDFTVTWPDAGQSALIADEAVQVFLDSRFQIEVTAGEAAVAILESNLEVANQQVSALGGDTVRDTDVPRGSKLEQALIVAQDARDQLNQAKLNLAGATAAFDYRYNQLEIPRVPTAPVSGSMISLVLTGIVALGLTLGTCAMLDLRRGKVQELWQIERMGVPVVAVLDVSSSKRRR